MKTTELFIEQVLIGLAVLVTVSLMANPDLVDRLLKANLREIAVVSAASYFLGILYDRLNDTILERLETYHRLAYAFGILEKDPTLEKEPNPKDGPFPEDRYRIAIMFNEAAWDHVVYLRSRIRLMRALCTLAPALAVAVAVYWFFDASLLGISLAAVDVRFVSIILVGATYAVCFLIGLKKNDLPRTEELTQAYLNSIKEQRPLQNWLLDFVRKNSLLIFVSNEPITIGALFLAALAAFIAGIGHGIWAALGAFGAALVATAICGWCWWRITKTFYTHLRDFSRFGPKSTASLHDG